MNEHIKMFVSSNIFPQCIPNFEIKKGRSANRSIFLLCLVLLSSLKVMSMKIKKRVYPFSFPLYSHSNFFWPIQVRLPGCENIFLPVDGWNWMHIWPYVLSNHLAWFSLELTLHMYPKVNPKLDGEAHFNVSVLSLSQNKWKLKW